MFSMNELKQTTLQENKKNKNQNQILRNSDRFLKISPKKLPSKSALKKGQLTKTLPKDLKKSPQQQEYKFSEEQDVPTRETDSNQMTIKDLCPEDKRKIGKLIEQLAKLKEDKNQLLKVMKERTRSYKKSVKRIKEQSEAVLAEQAKTEEKFKESLDLLKEYQQKLEKTQLQPQKEENLDQKTIQNRENQRTQQSISKEENLQHSERLSRIETYQRELIPKPQGKSELLSKREGESESRFQQFLTQSQETKGKVITPSPDKNIVNSEILKLKYEIEQITEGLKSLGQEDINNIIKQQQTPQVIISQPAPTIRNIANIEASFSGPQNFDFQQQFMEFEATTRRNNEQEKKLLERILIKKEFQTPHQEQNSSSSEEVDDVELAKKLLSLRKQKELQKKQELKKQQDIPRKEHDLVKLNKHLDQKLQTVFGNSQSYSLSLTLTQNDQTPSKQFESTPANKLQFHSKENVMSSSNSTPIPNPQRPKIYVENELVEDSAVKKIAFSSQQQIEQSRSSIYQSKADEQEMDNLIDSLNSKNYRMEQNEFLNESRPLQISHQKKGRDNFYDQGLFEVLSKIESPQDYKMMKITEQSDERNQSGLMRYKDMMDNYERMVKKYELNDE